MIFLDFGKIEDITIVLFPNFPELSNFLSFLTSLLHAGSPACGWVEGQ